MQEQGYCIGVDLHTTVIQVCVLDGAGDSVYSARQTGSELEGGLELVDKLATRFPTGRVVVEALGSNRWFVEACRARDLDVVVAHAARLGLKQSGRKTDKRDAYELARRLRLGDIEANAKAYHPTDEEYGWRQLLRRRHRMVAMRTMVISQLRAMLRAHRMAAPKWDLYSPKNLERLRETRFANELEQVCFEQQLKILTQLCESIAVLTEAARVLTEREERISPLLSLPYVGTVTAGTLAAELGDVKRFRSAKAVASYAGLVPRVTQSAERSHNGRLVRHGNRELRFVLGEWAVQLMSRHATVRKWAESRLRKSPKNKVRVALARKLLVGVWHTMRTGETFSLERCLATA